MKHQLFLNYTTAAGRFKSPLTELEGTIEEARAFANGYIQCMCDQGKWVSHGIRGAVSIEDNALRGTFYSITIE